MTLGGRRRALRWLGLAPVSLGVAGCAAPPMGVALRSAPPPGLAPQADLAEVPFFASGDDLCGPAVLASLLAAAGRPAALETLTAQVYLPGRQGTLQAEMLAGARRHGALAVELPPSLQALCEEVADGRPVGVLLNLALPWWPRWHYAVVVGYDLPQGQVRLHSGTRARDTWPLTTFEHTWARSGHWAFVTVPPGRLPRSASADAVLRALVGFDRTALPADAAAAWAAAAQRWPDRLSLAIGSGNAWLAADRPQAAAAAYEAAARRFDSAAAWNNLAQARARLGDLSGAIDAAKRALTRAEAAEPQWREAARRTLEEVGR